MVINDPKSPSNNHSTTSTPSSAPSGDSNSPNFTPTTFPSPWAQVVRGGETESVNDIHQSAPSSSSSSSEQTSSSSSLLLSDCSAANAVATLPPVDNSNVPATVVDSGEGTRDDNVVRSKKHAWKKPSNGVVDVGSVMGADSWPALSESTSKASGKFPSESSSKTSVDGSISISQGNITSHSPQRQGTSNAKSNSSTNYNVSNRSRPVSKIGGNIGPGPTNGSFPNPPPPPVPNGSFSNPPLPPPPPPFPVLQVPSISYGGMLPPSISNRSPSDHYRNNNWDARPSAGSFVPAINEPRGSSRRGNFESRPRGEGSYHNNYNNRRNQDRGSYVNTRDAHVPPVRVAPRGLLRHPPPSTAAFVGPQPIVPFQNPIGYPELFYFPPVLMDPYRGMPFFPHVQIPAPVPAAEAAESAESSLQNRIIKQIDYYFSDDNLTTDEFLRDHMDEQGWVPISLIAEFRRVKILTSDRQLILDSLSASKVVEVQGDKLRRSDEWMRWLPSSRVQAESATILPSGSIINNNLRADFQTITVEETISRGGVM